jgi:hypothetical protein
MTNLQWKLESEYINLVLKYVNWIPLDTFFKLIFGSVSQGIRGRSRHPQVATLARKWAPSSDLVVSEAPVGALQPNPILDAERCHLDARFMQMFCHFQEFNHLHKSSLTTTNICPNLLSRIDRKCARKPPRESVQTFSTQTKRHYVDCLNKGPKLSRNHGLGWAGPPAKELQGQTLMAKKWSTKVLWEMKETWNFGACGKQTSMK